MLTMSPHTHQEASCCHYLCQQSVAAVTVIAAAVRHWTSCVVAGHSQECVCLFLPFVQEPDGLWQAGLYGSDVLEPWPVNYNVWPRCTSSPWWSWLAPCNIKSSYSSGYFIVWKGLKIISVTVYTLCEAVDWTFILRLTNKEEKEIKNKAKKTKPWSFSNWTFQM